MSARIVIVSLFICLIRGLDGVAQQPNDEPQLMEFIASINQKLTKMEHQLTDKDVQIRNLETKLENHMAVNAKYVNDKEKEMQMKNLELDQLRQHVTSLTETLSETVTASRVLANRVSILEQTIIGDESSAESISARNSEVHGFFEVNDDPKQTRIQNDTIFSNMASEEVPSDDVVEDQTSETRQIRVVPSFPLAFHVELTNSMAVSQGTIVKYNNEALDDGDGYKISDGIYTVSETGTYVITWTTLSGFRSYIQTFLVVNGVKRGASFSDAQEIHDVHQASSVVVLRLNQGDHVFIQIGHTTTNTMYSDISYSARPTFSGWKLF
ncbi:uncharacterized protein LOC117315608 [Pecten maximus]|uniref:uncharacterized protein LOC117315608 n=1 Tax=Pecten maximus TaxID=6579 RepID=UPI001458966A|nr:uncharacterized protein LOC117315608 [Pecten maximus]